MKKYDIALLSFCFLLMVACQNERRSTPTQEEEVDSAIVIEESVETVVGLPALPYFVYFDEQEEQMEIERDPSFQADALHVDSLTKLFRMHYPEVPLNASKQEGNTLYLEIADPTFLTQQMGSSGAKTYLVEVTYAFTEISGIEQVNIVFEEGDHAVPGTYNRNSFKDDNILFRE